MKKSILYFRFLVVAFFTAAALCIYQTCLLFTEYDYEDFYYNSGSVSAGIFGILFCAAVVLSIISGWFFKKGDLPADPVVTALRNKSGQSMRAGKATSLVCAVFIAVIFAVLIIYSMPESTQLNPTDMTKRYEVTFRAAVYLMPLSAIYFAASGFITNKKLISVLGMISVFWTVIYQISVYYSLESPLNSPIRTINQLAFLSFTLFLLLEIRYLFSKPCTGLYVSAGFSSLILLITSSVPNIVAMIFGKRSVFEAYTVSQRIPSDNPMFILQALFAVYVAVRLISISTAAGKNDTPSGSLPKNND